MPKAIVSVNFYGHQNPNISGLKYGTVPLTRAFFKAAGAYVFGSNFDRVQEDKVKDIKSSNGKLWVYDYNAALNETDNKSFTKRLVDDIMMEIAKGEPNGNTPEMAFLLTGFSSGGVTAMHMAQQLEQIYMNVYYVGLSDAAFQRNESDYLMSKHNLKAKYKKNYFQTKQNASDVSEIHDEVTGFSNFNLNDRLVPGKDLHVSACTIANGLMFNDVKWCIENM